MKKYIPSIKANNQLRDKVVDEFSSYFYHLERGRYSSEADKEAVLRIMDDLKTEVTLLSNTVGTGKENVSLLANAILDLLKDLKKTSSQATLHRIQEVADDLEFNLNLWRDVLDGNATAPTESEIKEVKVNYARRKLNARLDELTETKDNFVMDMHRLEREIVGYEKDIEELDAQIVDEDNERRINELFKRISTLKSKVEALSVRKANYGTCFNLLDMIYVNVSEIVNAGDYAGEEIGKAKALLNVGKLKKVLSEPGKAVAVLQRMQTDIKEIHDKTQAIDAKIAGLSSVAAGVSEDALAYKAELMRKKRDRAILADELPTPSVAVSETITKTVTEEDK